MPPDGTSGSTNLPTPYQGKGAEGVNNLAAKLLLAMLPPNSSFFRLVVDDFTLEELTQQEGMRAKVEEALNKIERAVGTEIETTAIRVSTFEALKQLIVAGNVLLYLPPEGGLKVYRLDRYVVKRDPMGNVLEVIVKETVAFDTLPAEVQAILPQSQTNASPNSVRTVDVFTHIRRDGNTWAVRQEIQGTLVPGSEGTYPLDKPAWIALRWTKMDGEDYGRGHVEEYLGDLTSLEGLTQAIVEGSAAAAKVLILVAPNGQTDEKDVASAPSGSVRTGRKEDVSVVQLEKYADFRVASETIIKIEQRLSRAFLLTASIQRNAERVTAEEIRIMAGELEDALGGVYSILSQEFQLPLVRRLMHQMERQNRLPTIPKDTVRPAIVTGMEALGRGHDLSRLDQFLVRLERLGPEGLRRLNMGDLITRIGTSQGIDMKGLVKSEAEFEAELQREQMMAMGQQIAPEALKMAGQAMTQQ